MQQVPVRPFGETAMSTVETEQANGARSQRSCLGSSPPPLALSLDRLTSVAMPVGWNRGRMTSAPAAAQRAKTIRGVLGSHSDGRP